MTLRDLQSALFKLYLDPGFRLAHKLDPAAFVEHVQLRDEHADLVCNLSPGQVEEFASTLALKRMSTLSSMMPFTYAWLKDNHGNVIDAFQDVSVPSRLADRVEFSRAFVDFIEECADFHDAVPKALHDVARLEFLLLSHRNGPRPEQVGSAQPVVTGAHFSWQSLYWKPQRTTTAAFSSDALSILLGRKEMETDSGPTWIVVAAESSGGRPTILRITEPAFHVLAGLEEPISARSLLGSIKDRQLNVSKDALRALLIHLDQSNVIGSYHENEAKVGGA